jgi:hypothetical protein
LVTYLLYISELKLVSLIWYPQIHLNVELYKIPCTCLAASTVYHICSCKILSNRWQHNLTQRWDFKYILKHSNINILDILMFYDDKLLIVLGLCFTVILKCCQYQVCWSTTPVFFISVTKAVMKPWAIIFFSYWKISLLFYEHVLNESCLCHEYAIQFFFFSSMMLLSEACLGWRKSQWVRSYH